MPEKAQTSIRIQVEVLRRLEAEARRRYLSVSELVRQILAEWVMREVG